MSIIRDIVFVDTQVKWHNADLTLDLGTTTPGVYKAALWTDSVTPDASQVAPAYGTAPWNGTTGGEASGPGYTTAGQALTVVSFAELVSTPGKTGWIVNDLLWTETTITAKGLLVYRVSDNVAILLRAFAQSYPTNDGDFEVAFTEAILRRAHLGPTL